MQGLENLQEQIRAVLKLDAEVQALAKDLYQQKSLLIMGRGYNYATCLEGALKVKELTYMHSEGIMAGELKHGPLALIDDQMPVLMIVMRDPVYAKCMNALQQVSMIFFSSSKFCTIIELFLGHCSWGKTNFDLRGGR